MNLQCNTCKSDNIELLFKNQVASTTRMAKMPQDVCICKDCGMVFLDVREITEQDLAEYYGNNNPFELPEALDAGHQNLRNEQVAWYLDKLPKDDKVRDILDVGCGTGYVLHRTRETSHNNVFGAEFSKSMINNVKNTYNIDCFAANNYLENLTDRKFDVITCITVLEHVLDPNKMIAKFAQLLNPDGYIYIEVPDAQFPRFDMIPDHLAFEHIHHWTLVSLTNLLKLHNFEVIAHHQQENDADSGNPEAIVRVVAKLSNKLEPVKLENDYAAQKANLMQFRQRHQEYKDSIAAKINAIQDSIGDEDYAIYCGGLHTSMLFESFNFAKKPKYIIDSDPAINGKELNGIEVKHKDSLKSLNIKNFLLSTTNHEKVIAKFLRELLPEPRVFALYSDIG